MDGKVIGNRRRCPESRQTSSYPMARCSLNDKPCILQGGMECPTYEDWLFEERQEELDYRGRGEDFMTERQEEEFNDLFVRAFNLGEEEKEAKYQEYIDEQT